MPRRPGTAILEASIRGVTTKRLEHQLSSAQRNVHRQLNDALQQIGFDVQGFLQGRAPKRTMHLTHSIDQIMTRSTTRPAVTILIDVKDPEHPYDYVNVTRFGRKAVVAKRKSAPSAKLGSRPIAYGREYKRHSAAALQFEPGKPGTGFIYRRRVKAWRPKGGDWVAKARSAILEYADEVMEEEAEKIQKSIQPGAKVRFSGGRRVRAKVLR